MLFGVVGVELSPCNHRTPTQSGFSSHLAAKGQAEPTLATQVHAREGVERSTS